MTTSEFESKLRLQAESAGLVLTSDFVLRAGLFYDLLRKWNKATNLTALHLDGYSAHSLDRLFIEPLIAAELLPIDAALACVDVGSGGGSPAIPLAIARPLIRMLMVESVAKKAAFLREAVRIVELKSAEVRTGRLEEIAPERRHTVDLALVRGVRVDRALSSALRQMLAPGGRLFGFGVSRQLLEFEWRLTDQRGLVRESDLLVFEPVGSSR